MSRPGSNKTTCPTNRILTFAEATACFGSQPIGNWELVDHGKGFDVGVCDQNDAPAGTFSTDVFGTLQPGIYMMTLYYGGDNNVTAHTSSESFVIDHPAGYLIRYKCNAFDIRIDVANAAYQSSSFRSKLYASQTNNSDVPGITVSNIQNLIQTQNIFRLK